MTRLFVATLLGALATAPGGVQLAGHGLPAPKVTMADTAVTTKFDVSGVTVILRRNTANEVVVANLYLLGGSRQITSANQGIEALILAASERGTKRFPGAAARSLTAKLGSSIGIEANDDWSAIGMHAIRTTLDSTWAIFADRVMAPTLEANEVALVKDQFMSVARERGTNPDDAVSELADSLLYQNHPYSLIPTGTTESLARLTVAQLKAFHAQQFVTSRMLLVVVGNVDRTQVEKLVRGTIATMPKGSYRWTSPPPPPVGGKALALDNRSLPTNYILAYVPGPPATDRDYSALRVATAVLSGRLFTEIRSRRNLTYAVESPFLERSSAVAGLYVTTVDPNQVLRIMRDELTTLQTEAVDPAGLKRLVQQFITEYYLKNETNADQANSLARAELYQGDYRTADKLIESLRMVSSEDVRRVAQTYLKDFRFAYVGDQRKLDRNLLQQF
jgi:zinc protease